MHWLDLSLPTPAENLAADEALALACEAADTEALRFWESPVPFVALGYANRAAEHTDAAACRARGVPVLRRISGGGTVLQGPGCLNLALVLRIPADGPLSTVQGTNHFIMRRHAETLAALIGKKVEVLGHTDLAVDGKKFSGNAQRRFRTSLLFHGTFLLSLDLPLVAATLRQPPLMPDYREDRPHGDFITHIPATADAVKHALRKSWSVEGNFPGDLSAETRRLVAEKYSRAEWNEKF
jgi:lipoate-protein ligase A